MTDENRNDMDQATDFFALLAGIESAESAAIGYDAIRDLFTLFPEEWGGGMFREVHKANQGIILALLEGERGLSRVSRTLHLAFAEALSKPTDLRDPAALVSIAAWLPLLLDRYVPALSEQDRQQTAGAIEAALRTIADTLVEVSKHQIEALGQLITTLLLERKVRVEAKRIVLVELPIGNSIPTKVLQHVLEKHGRSVEVVNISLSRNESKRAGTTRRQLLEERLKGALREGDLTLYVDEWVSGSNFKAIIEHMRRIVESVAGVSFLPVGMLTKTAESERTFTSCVRKHKKLIARFGFGDERSSRFRIVFPPLPGVFHNNPYSYFFWSEHDRTSGYRKIQFLGITVGIIDTAVRRLMSGAKSKAEGFVHFLMQAAKNAQMSGGPGIPKEVISHPGLFGPYLQESYEDYLAIKAQLRAIEHPSNLGRADEPLQDLLEVSRRVAGLLEGRPAKACVLIALLLYQAGDRVDRAKGSLIDEHALVVVKLEGAFGLFHELLLVRIAAAIES